MNDLIGLHVSVGVSGSGKTFGIRRDIASAVRAGMPVVAIDRMKEWDEVPADLVSMTAGATNALPREAMARTLAAGRRLLVLRYDPSRPGALTDPIAAAIDACAWAREHRGAAGVALPEAHRVAPVMPVKLPPDIEEIATCWRHHQVALWADTQRLANLNKTVLENARDVRLYAMVGPRDLAAAEELASGMAPLVREAGARLARGEPGWHVRLGWSRLPPYELAR